MKFIIILIAFIFIPGGSLFLLAAFSHWYTKRIAAKHNLEVTKKDGVTLLSIKQKP